MVSLSYSSLEVPSSTAETITDDLNSILQEVEGCSLEVLLRKSNKRANIFSSSQVEASKIRDRLHDFHRKLEDSVGVVQKRITAQEIKEAEYGGEIASLKDCKNELDEKVRLLSAKIENLRKEKDFMTTVIEANKEFIGSLSSGFKVIGRINEQQQRSLPELNSDI